MANVAADRNIMIRAKRFPSFKSVASDSQDLIKVIFPERGKKGHHRFTDQREGWINTR